MSEDMGAKGRFGQLIVFVDARMYGATAYSMPHQVLRGLHASKIAVASAQTAGNSGNTMKTDEILSASIRI
ncbi:hypothetical protein BN2476_420027 [Paraburkholderia piptadeniae]|uniref:Uncharacterized protein n=1 Tax=Paraburkholderia piptadeniae TaxID=1701573 RepID=A0A1N7SAX6_9BURK|nr:hypothetical protein BN2476_420027 [Paraburkholderia piptadeniae]